MKEIIAPRSAFVIPCYGRADDLDFVLGKIHGKHNAHIFVFDDCSPSERVRETCAAYKDVRYIRTPRNLGIIGTRNFAARYLARNYEFLFHLDDDSFPLNEDHVRRTESLFDAEQNVAIVAFPIMTNGVKVPQGILVAQDIMSYVGCGNAWRSADLAEVGALANIFRRQGEEMEHSLRVWSNGKRVIIDPECVVEHRPSPTNRNRGTIVALSSTAYLKWSLIHWPRRVLLHELARWVIFTGRRAFEISWPAWIADLRSKEYGIQATCRVRRPISEDRLQAIRHRYREYRRIMHQSS